MGSLSSPPAMLALIGVFIAVIFYVKKVPAGLFIAILLTSFIGLVFTFCGYGVNDPLMPSIPASVLSMNFDVSLFGGFMRGFTQLFSNITNMLIIFFSLLFITFFDATGTIMALAYECGLVDENGEIIGYERALVSNALAGIIGAVFGTSSVSSYLESATGIEAGGRTGLTAVVIGICFLSSIFFSTFVLALFPAPVTASALILVGMIMINQLSKVNLGNPVVGISIFFTVMMMMLTNSISFGIAWGFSIFTILSIITDGFREMNKTMIVLTALFIIFIFIGL